MSVVGGRLLRLCSPLCGGVVEEDTQRPDSPDQLKAGLELQHGAFCLRPLLSPGNLYNINDPTVSASQKPKLQVSVKTDRLDSNTGSRSIICGDLEERLHFLKAFASAGEWE